MSDESVLGKEDLANLEDQNSGFAIGGKNSSRGYKSTSSSETYDFTRADPTREAIVNQRINNGKRPKCEASDRPHPPATHTIRFGDDTIPVCDFHLDQLKDHPGAGTIEKIGVSEQANNEIRRRSYIRKFNARNDLAESIHDENIKPENKDKQRPVPVVQTSGRPKPDSDKKTDELLIRKYGNDLGIDHVTPVIEEAERRGGKTENPYQDLD
jgi:hypothetical protein